MKAEIKEYGGIPTLFLDGRPDPALIFYCSTGVSREERFRDFAHAGVSIFTCEAGSSRSNIVYEPPEEVRLSGTWTGPESFDYDRVDEAMTQKIEWLAHICPKPLFLLRLSINPPAWWLEQHPNDVLRRWDGSCKMDLREGAGCATPTYPSYASEAWRRDGAEALRRFVEHIRSKPYGDNVIGYHLAAGNCGEWFYMGTHEGYIHDYSEPQIREFRKWLEQKYGKVLRLREAWHTDDVDFETALPPSPEKRTNPTKLNFLDPAVSQDVIDFNIFHSYMVADAIAHFCGAVKEASNGELLAGAFYGYILRDPFRVQREGDCPWAVGPMTIGHLCLQRILSSPSVDFLCAPSRYGKFARTIGTGYGHLPALTESVKMHGKLWLDENDYRTHLVPSGGKDQDIRVGKTDNLRDTISIQKREFSNVLCNAVGMWWMHMGNPRWFDEPEIMQAIEKMMVIGERRLRFDCNSVAETAVIVDTDSMCGNIRNDTFANFKPEIGHMGTPFDWLSFEDITNARPYKLYIFLNAYYLDDQKRQMVDAVVHQAERTVVWLHAAGFGKTEFADENCRDLTGIRIVSRDEEYDPVIRIKNTAHSVTTGIEEGFSFQQGFPLGPVFHADDPEADALGIECKSGMPGLVAKERDGVKTVYCATRFIPARILRNIARWAGVHVYIKEDDGIYANKSFFCLHTNLSGEKTIRFPRKTDVYDVFEEKQIAEGVDGLMLNLPEKHTVLYFLGSRKEWERGEKQVKPAKHAKGRKML